MITQVKLAVNKNVETLADVTNKKLSFIIFLWIHVNICILCSFFKKVETIFKLRSASKLPNAEMQLSLYAVQTINLNATTRHDVKQLIFDMNSSDQNVHLKAQQVNLLDNNAAHNGYIKSFKIIQINAN